MTQPEKEFEVGSFHSWGGKKYEYIGPTQGRIMGCFKKPSGEYIFIAYEQTEPWKTDPKPNTVDAWRVIHKSLGELAKVIYGPENDQIFEPINRGDRRGWAAKLRKLTIELGWLIPAPPIPPAVSAEFDEAAERKLFEYDLRFCDLERNKDGFYMRPVIQASWMSWLASAKVQRGAVPAVVAEVRRKVLQVAEIAPLTSIHDIVRKLRALSDEIADGSIATKLGGSNE